MPTNRVFGQNIFGTYADPDSAYRFPLWRYVVIALVTALACVYAAANLFPPDSAVQIQTDNAETVIGSRFANQLDAYLRQQKVDVKAVEVTEGGVQVRLTNPEDQLPTKALLETLLNPIGQERQFVVALNLAPTTPEQLRKVGAKPMSLGLDLAGGIHFVLQVDMDSALTKEMEDEVEKIKSQLRDANLRYIAGDDFIDATGITFRFTAEDVREAALASLGELYGPPNYELTAVDVDNAPGVLVNLSAERLDEIEDIAIEQNLTGLRSRVNELGVAEPLVQRLGGSRIVIDLPGVQDSSEAKRILDKFATLEFHLVAQPGDRPSQVEVLSYRGEDVRINRDIIVTGDNVTNARQARDPDTSLPQVNITLDSDGGTRLHDATAPNIGEDMAIVFVEQKPITFTEEVDGEVVERTEIESSRRLISVATIQGALGYNSRITGINMRDAQELAILLRAGALAAPMYFVEERTVGASLGQENIDRGIVAVTLGFVLVMIFMVVYYKVFGLVADIALTLNLVILIAVMSVLGATLSLPGIAGMVLTVGMAVDANVLIFSRIREELKNSPPALAIHNGYQRAFLTILDANVTTLFVALILLTIGSGPVAGFAVTLSIGIVTSMFTAVFVSRGLVHLIYGRRTVSKVWI